MTIYKVCVFYSYDKYESTDYYFRCKMAAEDFLDDCLGDSGYEDTCYLEEIEVI